MSQRERLRARQLATQTVRLPRDPVAYAAAGEELAAAVLAAQQKPLRGTTAGDAQARVFSARRSLDEADVEVFTLRALPPAEWEALTALHPPTEEQSGKGWAWNAAALRPELLAAAVVPADGEAAYTAEEWREFARDGRVSAGEQDLLFATAVALNTRAVQVGPGKG